MKRKLICFLHIGSRTKCSVNLILKIQTTRYSRHIHVKWIKIGYAYVFRLFCVVFGLNKSKRWLKSVFKVQVQKSIESTEICGFTVFCSLYFSSSSSRSSWVNPFNWARWCEWNYMARYAIGSVCILDYQHCEFTSTKTEWIVLHQNRNPRTRKDEKTEWCKANFAKINQNCFAKPMCHLMLIKAELSVRRLVQMKIIVSVLV